MNYFAMTPQEPPVLSASETAVKGEKNVKSQLSDRFPNTKTSAIFLCLIASFSFGCLSRVIFNLAQIRTHKRPPTLVCPTQGKQESIYDSDSCGVSVKDYGSYALEYVETIVHPAMLAHPNPLSVLIIGGTTHDADVQAILTEVFRHNSVERIAVVSSLQKRPQISYGSRTCQSFNEQVEYYDSLEILHQLLQKQRPFKNKNCHSAFDVMILLHPFDLFSNIDKNEVITGDTYFMEISSVAPATIQKLSTDDFMSKDCILVSHLGPSPHLARKSKMQLQDGCDDVDCDENLQLKLIKYMTDHTPFKDLHIFEDSNGPGLQGIRTPQSFLLMCKDRNCRQRWYADECYMNYQIRKRLSSFPSNVDGATLQRYNRPPKAWESLFCSFPNKKRECGYMSGFDPAVPNVRRESFEVKPSSIGKNVGRGMFTKVDIVEGSYFMQEVTVQQVRFSVQSFAAIFNVKSLLLEHYNITDDEDDDNKDFDNKGWYGIDGGKLFEIDSLITYMDGYGYDIDIYGGSGCYVDSGMNTFVNHGCNKTFNFGPVFYVFDLRAGIDKSEYENLLLSEEEADPDKPPEDEETEEDLFNPLIDRHLEHLASSYEGSISPISKGEEIFSNYVFYYGADSWSYGIRDLRSQCRGEKIGTIVRIEGKMS